MSPKQQNKKMKEETELPANYKLGRFDVICARGKLALDHEGNQRMKALVQSCLPQYAQSSCKVVKSKIVSSVVNSVREASPEGGFVKFVDDGWVRVNDRFAREKVGQTFRDLLHTKYRSSTKAKARARGGTVKQQGLDNVVNNTLITSPHQLALRQGDILQPPPLTPVVSCCGGEGHAFCGASTPPAGGAATAMLAATLKQQKVEPINVSSFFPSMVVPNNNNSLASQLACMQHHQVVAPPCQQQQLPPPPSLPEGFLQAAQPTKVGSSNFLGQLFQCLDRSSSVGSNTEDDGLSALKASDSNAPLPLIPSTESTLILSDLEPTPLKEDLLNSSAVFSIDTFRWETHC